MTHLLSFQTILNGITKCNATVFKFQEKFLLYNGNNFGEKRFWYSRIGGPK